MEYAEVDMVKVCVFMSTYNGERYIKEQMDSILNQEDVEVCMSIRDDGSTDSTASIIQEYVGRYNNISLEIGENVGYSRSFFSLIKNDKSEYDYFAFSDQDDIWDRRKLISAINKMSNEVNYPIVYSCNLELVDENLNHIGYMEEPTLEDFQAGRYILDKYSYGCSMVFNKEMKRLVAEHLPKICISHDNWVGLIGVFIGKYVYDDISYIKYRQHGNNVTGGKADIISTWKRRIKNYSNLKKESKQELAVEILEQFDSLLDVESKQILYLLANYKKTIKDKIKLLLCKKISRKSKEKDFLFRILVIFSKA